MFFSIVLVQTVFICSFTGLLSIWIREARFDAAIRIGWPAIFFTAFDANNDTLNYSGNVGNLIIDLGVSFLVALLLMSAITRLLK